jgi:hypothetical protein
MWLELGLDAVLFSGALFVYFRQLRSDRNATISPYAFPSSMERTTLG